MLRLPAIRTENFALVCAESGTAPLLRLSGNADAEVVAPLDRTLKLLHDEMLHAGARSVVVDLAELYFMSSSCLKAFVSWIYKVRTTGKPYQIRLQYNPRLRWQQRGLEPLQRLAPGSVFLDEVVDFKTTSSTSVSHRSATGKDS